MHTLKYLFVAEKSVKSIRIFNVPSCKKNYLVYLNINNLTAFWKFKSTSLPECLIDSTEGKENYVVLFVKLTIKSKTI